MTDT
jgi:hypothetical protein